MKKFTRTAITSAMVLALTSVSAYADPGDEILIDDGTETTTPVTGNTTGTTDGNVQIVNGTKPSQVDVAQYDIVNGQRVRRPFLAGPRAWIADKFGNHKANKANRQLQRAQNNYRRAENAWGTADDLRNRRDMAIIQRRYEQIARREQRRGKIPSVLQVDQNDGVIMNGKPGSGVIVNGKPGSGTIVVSGKPSAGTVIDNGSIVIDGGGTWTPSSGSTWTPTGTVTGTKPGSTNVLQYDANGNIVVVNSGTVQSGIVRTVESVREIPFNPLTDNPNPHVIRYVFVQPDRQPTNSEETTTATNSNTNSNSTGVDVQPDDEGTEIVESSGTLTNSPKTETSVNTKPVVTTQPKVQTSGKKPVVVTTKGKTSTSVKPSTSVKKEPAKKEPVKKEPVKKEPVKNDTKVEVPKTETKVEPKTETKVEPKTETKVEVKVEPKTETKDEVQVKIDTPVKPEDGTTTTTPVTSQPKVTQNGKPEQNDSDCDPKLLKKDKKKLAKNEKQLKKLNEENERLKLEIAELEKACKDDPNPAQCKKERRLSKWLKKVWSGIVGPKKKGKKQAVAIEVVKPTTEIDPNPASFESTSGSTSVTGEAEIKTATSGVLTDG